MSCGTKIDGRFHSWLERQDLADHLENVGEYRIAQSVRRGDCLDDQDLRLARNGLENRGLSRLWDYREKRCVCEIEDAHE